MKPIFRMMKKSDSKSHRCTFDGCGKTFSRPSRLEVHIRTHTGEKPFICSVKGCNKSYARHAHLKRHQETFHAQAVSEKPRLTCSNLLCEKTFLTTASLKRHLKSHHNENEAKIQCIFDDCKQSFTKQYHLKEHLISFHKFEYDFKCHVEGCSRIFKTKQHLKRHMKVHDGYACNIVGCTETFTLWSSLRKHMAQAHKRARRGSRNNSTSQAIKRDEASHASCSLDSKNTKLFKCEFHGCTQQYTTMYNLKVHHQIHHKGLSPFACDKCSKCFAYKKSLIQHQKVHSSDYADFLTAMRKRKYPNKGHRRKTAIQRLLGFRKEEIDRISETTSITGPSEELYQSSSDDELINTSGDELIDASDDELINASSDELIDASDDELIDASNDELIDATDQTADLESKEDDCYKQCPFPGNLESSSLPIGSSSKEFTASRSAIEHVNELNTPNTSNNLQECETVITLVNIVSSSGATISTESSKCKEILTSTDRCQDDLQYDIITQPPHVHPK